MDEFVDLEDVAEDFGDAGLFGNDDGDIVGEGFERGDAEGF